MSFTVGLLTILLVINCFMLIFLVLVQLPKKDAGAGIAFGGGTADALFGSGSGNVLTKITKWATVSFLVLAVLAGYLQDRTNRNTGADEFTKQVQQKQMQTPVVPAQQTQPAAPAATKLLTTVPTAAPATNAAK